MSQPGSSYAQILRSSALMGGTSLLNLLVGIVRMKVMALLLGPSGVGLMGAYAAIADLARSVAEMGINQSGVRQMAEADSSGDVQRVARTATVLRRVAVLLGLVGVCVLALFATPVAELSFGSARHSHDVALLGLAVLFSIVAGGQAALLQGLRRIADLARMTALGAALGTLASIPIVYLLREDGVVPALVAGAGISALISTWYGRKLRIRAPAMPFVDVREDALALLRLGLAFMTSGLLMMGAAYAVRVFVLRETGLEGAGFFQAGWTLGGLYVGFILQAMATDFYPRLVAHIHDHRSSNRLVNEQARVSLLLAGPGVIATLVLAPPLTTLLYSAGFANAIEVLRWICIGTALRVITWPMGYLIVAKNRQGIFIGAELAWTIVNVGLSWVLVTRYGVAGAGMAFFGSYVFHALLVYPIVRHMTGFSWARDNVGAMLLFVSLAGTTFLGFMLLPPVAAYSLGISLLIVSAVQSVRSLMSLAGGAHIPNRVLRLLSILRFARP